MENMEIYAKEFLKKYKEDYDFNFNEKEDREEFIDSINKLEAYECAKFLESKGLSAMEYKDFKDTLKRLCKSFINTENKDIICINNKDLDLKFYQKIIAVFNEFDYDHLDDLEKHKLIEKIYKDEFLSNEKMAEFKITFDEYESIKEILLNSLLKFSNNGRYISEKDNSEIYQCLLDKYNQKIKDADESFFEVFEGILNIDFIRKDNKEAENLLDDEISTLIDKIKESGKNITFDKIIKLPEVNSFVERFNVSIMDCKCLEDLEELSKYLDDFQNSTKMLSLTEFNKNLLISMLREDIQIKQMILSETNNIISKIPKMDGVDLLNLLNNYDMASKDEVYMKNDKEFNETVGTIMEEILNELTSRLISKDIETAKDLDKFESDVNCIIDEYDISSDLKNRLFSKVNNRISLEKAKRKVKNKYLNIGDFVSLTDDVIYYKDANKFVNGAINVKNDTEGKIYATNKFVNKETVGTISAYVVISKKDKKFAIVYDLKTFEEYLNKGYEFAGYKFDYDGKLFKKSTYVKPNKVKIAKNLNNTESNKKSLKVLAKRHWKKAAMGAAVLSVIIAAGVGISSCNKKDNEPEKPVDNRYSNEKAIDNDAVKDENTINKENEKGNNEEDLAFEESLGKEVRDILASMPNLNSEFNISKDAKIYVNKKFKNGKTSYFNNHKDYDLKRNTDGYVLRDENGKVRVLSDIDKAIDLVIGGKYTYIGVRVLNEYSKSDTDYEGFYKANDLIINDANSVLNDYSKTLTRTK